MIPFPGLIFHFTRKLLGLIQPNKRQVITVISIQKECHLFIMNQVTSFALISFVSKMIHATLLFYWYLHIIFTHLNDRSLSNNCKLETVLQAKALTAPCPCPATEVASRGSGGHTGANNAEERRLSFIPVHIFPSLGYRGAGASYVTTSTARAQRWPAAASGTRSWGPSRYAAGWAGPHRPGPSCCPRREQGGWG